MLRRWKTPTQAGEDRVEMKFGQSVQEGLIKKVNIWISQVVALTHQAEAAAPLEFSLAQACVCHANFPS